MLKVRSHRRAEGLKPGDYDHEISLCDQDGAQDPRPTSSDVDLRRGSTTSHLISQPEEQEEGRSHGGDDGLNDDNGDISDRRLGPDDDINHNNTGEDQPWDPTQPTQDRSNVERLPAKLSQPSLQSSDSQLRPSIEIQAPSPDVVGTPSKRKLASKRSRKPRETAIDILYENERGGFLCGTALFSGKALGSLDPSPWTNAYHKTSPTSIHTATVPDPSWEWVSPEWRINHQDGLDEGGWEYSFAFSKKFSWHGPKWWNSFVRRRAWIRKRAKRRPEDISSDPHMLNSDYFTVRPASDRSRRSPNSLASSRVPSKSSMTQASSTHAQDGELPDIQDVETLLQRLRLSRIDREKREAVENYLEHAIDLAALEGVVHEIMGIFVFQTSRKQLLRHLMQKHDETAKELEERDTPELHERIKALDAAYRHANEEVRKLAYWSDVRQMADGGEFQDHSRHDGGDDGLDNSGPSEPNNGKLPGPGPGPGP